MGKKDDTG